MKRGQHGRHKISKEVHAIFQIGPNGEPLLPETVIGTFSGQIACLVKEIVPPTYQDWRKVPEDLKGKVWKGVLLRFNYPQEQFDTKRCMKHAMTVAGKALRTFRNHLYTDYVQKGRSPLEDYNFLTREIWDEFVKMVSTPEFEAKSQKGKELAKKNEHKHNLGNIGYAGHRNKWR